MIFSVYAIVLVERGVRASGVFFCGKLVERAAQSQQPALRHGRVESWLLCVRARACMSVRSARFAIMTIAIFRFDSTRTFR